MSNLTKVTLRAKKQVHGRLVAVSALLDDQMITRSGGYGGWSEIARPGRSTVLEWIGTDAVKETFGLMFDGWRDQNDVEHDIQSLEYLATSPGAFVDPPIITCTGALSLSGKDVVITALTWGDSIRDSHSGRRYRQQATVEITAYVAPAILVAKAHPGGKYRRAGTPARKHYTCVAGDTFQRIAQKLLKDVHRWHEIVDLNPKLNNSSKLHTGQVIWVPWS